MQERLIKLPLPGDYGDIPKEHSAKLLSPSAFSLGLYKQSDCFSNEVQGVALYACQSVEVACFFCFSLLFINHGL